HAIATIACKAAVKAHDRLSAQEALRLVEDLKECKDGTCCPHGRPSMISLNRDELARRFKRPAAPPHHRLRIVIEGLQSLSFRRAPSQRPSASKFYMAPMDAMDSNRYAFPIESCFIAFSVRQDSSFKGVPRLDATAG